MVPLDKLRLRTDLHRYTRDPNGSPRLPTKNTNRSLRMRRPLTTETDFADPVRLHSYRYRMGKNEDGTLRLFTAYRCREGLVYDVCAHSAEELSACVPPKAGKRLLRKHPVDFKVSQMASDAMVLVFDRRNLGKLAGSLRLRKRRRASTGERARLCRMTMKYSPFLNGPNACRA